jgi:hypothetical protein
MKYLLAVASLMLVSLPAQSETVYLIIKSKIHFGQGSGISLYSIPMDSMDQCEEQGAVLVTSERFDLRKAAQDAFECITGK